MLFFATKQRWRAFLRSGSCVDINKDGKMHSELEYMQYQKEVYFRALQCTAHGPDAAWSLQ
jgi:hypothetical protein